MSFVSNLEALMRERDINQSELGRRLGITSQAVNQWLRKIDGGTMPKGKRLEDVAAAIGVPVNALFAEPPSGVLAVSPKRRASSKRSPYDGAIPDAKRTSKFGNQSVDIRFEAIWNRLNLGAKKAVLAIAIEVERGRKSGAA